MYWAYNWLWFTKWNTKALTRVITNIFQTYCIDTHPLLIAYWIFCKDTLLFYQTRPRIGKHTGCTVNHFTSLPLTFCFQKPFYVGTTSIYFLLISLSGSVRPPGRMKVANKVVWLLWSGGKFQERAGIFWYPCGMTIDQGTQKSYMHQECGWLTKVRQDEKISTWLQCRAGNFAWELRSGHAVWLWLYSRLQCWWPIWAIWIQGGNYCLK